VVEACRIEVILGFRSEKVLGCDSFGRNYLERRG